MKISSVLNYNISPLNFLKRPQTSAFRLNFKSNYDTFEKRYNPDDFSYPDFLFNAMRAQKGKNEYRFFNDKGELVRIGKKELEDGKIVYNCAEIKDGKQVSQTQYDKNGYLRCAKISKDGIFKKLEPEMIEHGEVTSYRLETTYKNGAIKTKIGSLKDLDPYEPVDDTIDVIPETLFIEKDGKTIMIEQIKDKPKGLSYVRCLGYDKEKVENTIFSMLFSYKQDNYKLLRYGGRLKAFNPQPFNKLIKDEGFNLN